MRKVTAAAQLSPAAMVAPFTKSNSPVSPVNVPTAPPHPLERGGVASTVYDPRGMPVVKTV